MKKQLKFYIFLSFLGHLFLLLSGILYLTITEEFLIKNDNNHNVMSIYTPSSPLFSAKNSQKMAQKSEEKSQKNKQKKEKIILKNAIKNTAASLNSTAKNKPFFAENGSHKHELEEEKILKILHEAIALKQNYPQSALELNQKGTVKIGFFLSPNGDLTQISVLQTSGFLVLDQAALEAVSDVSPLKKAETALHKKEYFSIDVMFK